MNAEGASYCQLQKAVDVISGRWRAVLICILLTGPKRFSDLQRKVPGISQRMLALDLRNLEGAGIIARNVLPAQPIRVEYQLTEKGLALSSIVHELRRWGQSRLDKQAAISLQLPS